MSDSFFDGPRENARVVIRHEVIGRRLTSHIDTRRTFAGERREPGHHLVAVLGAEVIRAARVLVDRESGFLDGVGEAFVLHLEVPFVGGFIAARENGYA